MVSRVLIVEDDDVLRWLMTEAITHLGYEATGCISADAALLKLEVDHSFNLLITDVVMPGQCDGICLAKAIWSTRPDFPIIIVSGNTVLPPGFLPANGRFIAKPCTFETLNRTMLELLAIR